MAWVATAVIGGSVVSGVMGAKAQKGAAKTAAAAQTEASQLSIEEQRRQFDEIQKIMAPYVASGEPALQDLARYSAVGMPALDMQNDLLGTNGPEAQQAAIAQIESSPMFQAQIQQGENALLQNASATGGLRGGNTQAALAQFRPAMLNQEIQNQYSRLGGMAGFGQANAQNLATIGQASAAGVGAQGMQSASNIGNLLTQAGQANAQSALAQGQATANAWGNVGGTISALGTLGAYGKGPLG